MRSSRRGGGGVERGAGGGAGLARGLAEPPEVVVGAGIVMQIAYRSSRFEIPRRKIFRHTDLPQLHT